MTVRGGGVPAQTMAFVPRKRMGPLPRSFAADAHDCIMVRVLGPTEYKVVARLIRAPARGLPSDRHPDRIERAAVLGAVKVWPGKHRARGKVGATANLDSSCARRLCNSAGRDEETGFQVEQRNRSRKQERKITALKPLDNKSPIQGWRRGTPLDGTGRGRWSGVKATPLRHYPALTTSEISRSNRPNRLSRAQSNARATRFGS
jgi:hypothetical protein